MAEQQKLELTMEALQDAPRETLLEVIRFLLEENALLKQRIEALENRLNANSGNSSKPPSSDPPYKRKKKEPGKKGKPGGKKGHKGSRYQMLAPTREETLPPKQCSCGNRTFVNEKPVYTHQHLELPKIELQVTHFILQQGKCTCCGKVSKGTLPAECRTGYGPRLSAVIAELAGSHGDSRSTVQNFCASVLGFSISLGAIQKVLDRTSKAIAPHYEEIGAEARRAEANHADETSWFLNGVLCWLWVLANSSVALFMIHGRRSKEAFRALVKDWCGILISDGYGVYRDWLGQRQTCLAHLIRDAKALSERKDEKIAKFGKKAHRELQRLTHMAHSPPTMGEWRAFYARFTSLIRKHAGKGDDAAKFAARLLREYESLWLFLEKAEVVSPTNNHAERMLRFAVCWRKRSYGTASEKGSRWVERMLSLRQTCRLRKMRTFPVLVEALDSHFKERKPDLAWIAQTGTL
jgi:transposase